MKKKMNKNRIYFILVIPHTSDDSSTHMPCISVKMPLKKKNLKEYLPLFQMVLFFCSFASVNLYVSAGIIFCYIKFF